MTDITPDDLYNRALVYIVTMPRTERQVRTFLMKRNGSRDTCEHILARLKEANLINDRSYAAQFADTKSTKLSRRAIRTKLAMRGISASLADEALANIDANSQDELARTVAAKYMRTKDTNPQTLLKLNRYLITKGFEYDTVSDIVSYYKRGGQ